MKSLKYYVILLCISFALNGFAQNKSCTGSEYTTNELFYRASANGSSMDVTASKKKALSNARNAIITDIFSKIESAIGKQKGDAMYKKKMLDISMAAIRQEAGNIKVICENSNQINQKYESNVVVEINKESVITKIINQITSDNTLKPLFDVDLFKKNL